MNLQRLGAVMSKELRQLRRDRITFGMVLMIPLLQLVLFGYAINTNVRGLRTGIADEAGTSASRMLVMDMLASGVLQPVLHGDSPQEVSDALRRGQISVGVVVPADFERRRAEGRELLQVMVDGSDNAVHAAAAQLVQVPVDGGNTSPLRQQQPISVVGFYNPQRRSALNIVPGLIGVILTMTMVLFTAVSIVRERERGNMELLIATPLATTELMVGKVLPYIGIGLIQTTVVLAAGHLLFHVPIGGTLLDVYLASLLLIVANLALGLLISTAARSQFQAMQMMIFIFLPSVLLSGFMFPFSGMPAPVQWIAELLPLTHFLRLIRGIMLRGASLVELWPSVLALMVFSVVMMSLSILRFRKRLD